MLQVMVLLSSTGGRFLVALLHICCKHSLQSLLPRRYYFHCHLCL
jgi:hypothetical protein